MWQDSGLGGKYSVNLFALEEYGICSPTCSSKEYYYNDITLSFQCSGSDEKEVSLNLLMLD